MSCLFTIFLYLGVMCMKNDVCGVTLSLYQHRASSEICPVDLEMPTQMLCQLSHAIRLVRVCGTPIDSCEIPHTRTDLTAILSW